MNLIKCNVCSIAMAAIVFVSLLIIPIVYFLNLPHFTTELVASFGFGFGAIVTLTLVFVPKMGVDYQLNAAQMAGKIVPDIGVSPRNKYHPQDLTGTGNTAPIFSNPGYDQQHEECERLLKGKTNEEKLVVCQEMLVRWQMQLVTQQRIVLKSTSSRAKAASDGQSDGVKPGSSAHIRVEPSIKISVGPNLRSEKKMPRDDAVIPKDPHQQAAILAAELESTAPAPLEAFALQGTKPSFSGSRVAGLSIRSIALGQGAEVDAASKSRHHELIIQDV
jgi:hypothetical protein